MMRCSVVGPAVVASALALFGARRALAEVCPGSDVAVDAELARRQPALRTRVLEALESQRNLDPCARIRLSWRADAIAVTVELADGRTTQRTVAQNSDVVPTLAALLVLPQATADTPAERVERVEARPDGSTKPAPAAPAAPNQPVKQPALVTRALRVRASQQDDAGSTVPAQTSGLKIELAAVTGARIGDGQASLGVGALSLLEISGWLAGFSARADRYHALGPGDSSSSALELALLAGYRLRTGNTALDLIAGLAVVPQGTSTYEEQGPSGRMAIDSSSSTVGRLVLGARATLFARSIVRPLVGIDAELGPARSGDTTVPNSPRLPLWTVGLCTGLSLGT